LPRLAVPTVRVAEPTDVPLLGAFDCSRGEWYEDEVEEFIRRHALAYAGTRRHLDHRLLLYETDAEGLVAVGAHELADFRRGGEHITGTYLVVGAIALPYQGARLEDGTRLSDFLLDALLGDARGFDRGPVIQTRVARDNERSLALLRRRGFSREIIPPGSRYVDLFGHVAA
jgi:RimJ/RimL family protein N-acetyltransferase